MSNRDLGGPTGAVECVARMLAAVHAAGKFNIDLIDTDDDAACRKFVDSRWVDFEGRAKRMIRELKDQPPHVTDEALSSVTVGGALNAMLEAMARS